MGGAPSLQAVIFDLWETLIDWDAEAAALMTDRIDAILGGGERLRNAFLTGECRSGFLADDAFDRILPKHISGQRPAH